MDTRASEPSPSVAETALMQGSDLPPPRRRGNRGLQVFVSSLPPSPLQAGVVRGASKRSRLGHRGCSTGRHSGRAAPLQGLALFLLLFLLLLLLLLLLHPAALPGETLLLPSPPSPTPSLPPVDGFPRGKNFTSVPESISLSSLSRSLFHSPTSPFLSVTLPSPSLSAPGSRALSVSLALSHTHSRTHRTHTHTHSPSGTHTFGIRSCCFSSSPKLVPLWPPRLPLAQASSRHGASSVCSSGRGSSSRGSLGLGSLLSARDAGGPEPEGRRAEPRRRAAPHREDRLRAPSRRPQVIGHQFDIFKLYASLSLERRVSSQKLKVCISMLRMKRSVAT
ncbi:uncharacterized protein LOC141561889 [Sminthopsis crassicaudata]|uniref:uncharacterized protein LOC141561889 n=1 Tax=Sminthopsis crassicaudata TaxID=9301 RepID=UPI003D684B6F